LAQKFSASSLGKFGYELAFVRNYPGVAVITEDGDINTAPNIHIRD